MHSESRRGAFGALALAAVVALAGAVAPRLARAEGVAEHTGGNDHHSPKRGGRPGNSDRGLIEGVPHVRQKPDFCGEACAAMYLKKLGYQYDQDAVFDASGLDPLRGRGCYTAELNRALIAIGFDTGEVWHRVPAERRSVLRQWERLRADLARGIPSIVCMYYGPGRDATEHFRLVLGYDVATDEVIYHEPAAERGAYQRMPLASFLELWPLKYDPRRWTLISMRLKPGPKLAAPPIVDAQRSTLTDADYAQHIMKLEPRLPHKGFTIVICRPFVVIGDEAAVNVRRRADRTVKWTFDALKKGYFKQDPDHIIDIWLFKDKASYEKYAKQLFGRTPHTPFGYYSASDRAMVMNIATGGGTLAHEIVHPLMAANFPACPAWFNEGLGSLYEQCRHDNGTIQGLTNWRLAGLQEAIEADRVPSFEHLTAMTEHEFYNRDQGTNYAQARYLCYYLQEQRLLRKFHHQFVANQKTDPSGYKTLQAVLGEEDMQAFKKKWQAFVLKLRFP